MPVQQRSSIRLVTATDGQSTGLGILYMTLGTAIVPVMDAIAKLLGDALSPLQVAWGRFLFQALLLVLPTIALLGLRGLVSQRPLLHAVRGSLIGIATCFFFFSLKYLPLADAIAIFFVQPMLLALISAVFLGEQIGWHRRIAVVMGFAGALLIIRPGSEAFTAASLLPLCAALFFSGYLAITRAVANIDHPMTMQLTSGVAAALLLGIALLLADTAGMSDFAPVMPTVHQWLMLAAIGLIATVGHLLVVMGMNRAPASLLAPFGYVEIVAATALGWWLFDDWPDTLTWFGIAIIVASGIYVLWRERVAGLAPVVVSSNDEAIVE